MIKSINTDTQLTPNEKAKEIIFSHLSKTYKEIVYHHVIHPMTEKELVLVKLQIDKRISSINDRLGKNSICLSAKIGGF